MRSETTEMIAYFRDAGVVHEYQKDRYGGPVGRWFRQSEECAFRNMVESLNGMDSYLDIGTGPGKLRSTIDTGMFIGLDTSSGMLAISRNLGNTNPLILADAVDLPLWANSIDLVMGSRILMHVHDWCRMIEEACRVARKAIILDYPTYPSLAALEPSIWRLSRGRMGPPIHLIFEQREVDEVFGSRGFYPKAVHKGFFLPYRVHRLLGMPRFSARLETVFRKTGLTDRFGSPAYALYVSDPE